MFRRRRIPQNQLIQAHGPVVRFRGGSSLTCQVRILFSGAPLDRGSSKEDQGVETLAKLTLLPTPYILGNIQKIY